MSEGFVGPPVVEQGQQLPCVVQVVARDPAEAERVQVAEGDGGERHDRGRDLIQSGDVRVLQVIVDPVHADVQQERQGAQEHQEPQAAFDAEALVREDVRDAVQGRAVRENFYGRRSVGVDFLGFYFEIHGYAKDAESVSERAAAVQMLCRNACICGTVHPGEEAADFWFGSVITHLPHGGKPGRLRAGGGFVFSGIGMRASAQRHSGAPHRRSAVF